MTRKEIDQNFLAHMLRIAGSNIFLKMRAYLYYFIVRSIGGVSYSPDTFDGCGISFIWATGPEDVFYHACQLHDRSYVGLKKE